MSGLPVEQVFGWVMEKFFGVRRWAFRIVFPDGWCTFLATLVFDGLEFNGIHGDGVGTKVQRAHLFDEVLHLCERTSMPHEAHAVHDVQYGLGAQRFG